VSDTDLDPDFITIGEACKIIGGQAKPIHNSTFWRNVQSGRYSAPERPCPGIVRIRRPVLLADIKAGKATVTADDAPEVA
jgi:hypothetical protein